MENNIYDVIIIGAGPAGMNAALYTSRANLKTLMIEKECPGGKMLKAAKIENYIGSSTDNAIELASNMFRKSISFGAKYKQGNVVDIKLLDDSKQVVLSNGESFKCKAIIIAVGGKIVDSNFKYDKYLNRGLSYCVVCDGNFYKGKIVAVIGDNNSIDDVTYISNLASKVYYINKEDKYSNRENVVTYPNTSEYEIIGDKIVEFINVNGEMIKIDGAFYVGNTNNFNGFTSMLSLEKGFIKVDSNMNTSIEGVFACGDIVNKNIKQVISACGDGASAGLEAIKYVIKNK